jgi:hypothetical protein
MTSPKKSRTKAAEKLEPPNDITPAPRSVSGILFPVRYLSGTKLYYPTASAPDIAFTHEEAKTMTTWEKIYTAIVAPLLLALIMLAETIVEYIL